MADIKIPDILPMSWNEIKSYSRYRGITDRFEYGLSNQYIWKDLGNKLICTDEECDIDYDGNLCLVTKYGDVIHIGTIPQTESPAPEAKVSLVDDTIAVSCRVYLDNSHHHSNIKEYKYSAVWNNEYFNKILINRAATLLSENVRSLRSKGLVSISYDKNGVYIRDDEIKYGYRYSYKENTIHSLYFKLDYNTYKFSFGHYDYHQYHNNDLMTKDSDFDKHKDEMRLNYKVEDIISSLNDYMDKIVETYKDFDMDKTNENNTLKKKINDNIELD